jgi:hypothetical protein
VAISHVNTTVYASPGTTDTTVVNNVPSGVVDGDLLLWELAGVLGTASAPTGWLSWAAVTNAASRLSIFYRFASSEPASYTATVPSGRWNGIMSAYRGVDQTTPQDATPTTASSATTPAIVTATNGAYALSHGMAISASGVTNTNWTSSNGSIAGQTTQTQGAATNDTSAAAYLARPTAGSVTVNLVGSGTLSTQCRISSALRPATTLAATATGTLSLSATGDTAAQSTSTGSVSLSGTASTGASDTATGALALAAAATVTAPATATATLALIATATASAPTTGTATLSLSATAATTASDTATGTVVLSATAATSAAATGTGTLTLVGTGAGRAPATATGLLTLDATAALQAQATATGMLVLSGTGIARVAPIPFSFRVLTAATRIPTMRAATRGPTISATTRASELEGATR